MRKRTFRATLACATLMVSFVSAHAGMTVDEEPAPSQDSNSAPFESVATVSSDQQKTPQVIIEHVGKMPSKIHHVSIRMKNAPIGKVLASLVPKGWSGYASDPRIKTMGAISFNGGGRHWPVVLEEVLKRHGLVARIDWKKHELSVGVGENGVR